MSEKQAATADPAVVAKALDRVEKAAQMAAKAEGQFMTKRVALIESVEKAKGAGATREQVEAKLQATGLSESSVMDVLLKGGFRVRKERADKGKPKAKVVSQTLAAAEGEGEGEGQPEGDILAAAPEVLAAAILSKRGVVGSRALLAALAQAINSADVPKGQKPPRKAAQG